MCFPDSGLTRDYETVAVGRTRFHRGEDAVARALAAGVSSGSVTGILAN